MQVIIRLLPQTIVRGSSSRRLLTSRTTLGRVVAAPLAPCSSLSSLLSIRHKSASSFAANVDEPSATGDEDGAAEVPVLNTKGKGSLSQNTHSAKSQKMPPKHEKHRSQWTDEENFAEVLKRTPQLPQQSYTEEHFKNSIAAIAAKFRNIVDKRLALYERSDPSSLELCAAVSGENPVLDCCTVQRDRNGFVLQVQDKSMIRDVVSALKRNQKKTGIRQQHVDVQEQDGVIRIEVPPPNLHSRLKLLRELHMIIEDGRTKMRNLRSTAHKQLKRDWFEKRISKDDWLAVQKRMFTEARRGTDELLNVDRPMKREVERIKGEISRTYNQR